MIEHSYCYCTVHTFTFDFTVFVLSYYIACAILLHVYTVLYINIFTHKYPRGPRIPQAVGWGGVGHVNACTSYLHGTFMGWGGVG